MSHSNALSPAGFRWISWDGLSLAVPEGFEPAALGLGYLRFADERGASLECKWSRAAKDYNLESELKRLSKKAGFTPKDWPGRPLPEPPSGCEARFFLMPEAGQNSQAALLHFLKDGQALMLRVSRSGREGAALFQNVLGSLRVVQGLLEVYDIKIKISKGYKLKESKFMPGSYSLSYEHTDKSRLEYARFAPASVILKQLDLGEFAKQKLGQDKTRNLELEEIEFKGNQALWLRPKNRTGIFSIFACFGRSLSGLLWLDAQHDKILSLSLASKKRPSLAELETIAQGYEIIQ